MNDGANGAERQSGAERSIALIKNTHTHRHTARTSLLFYTVCQGTGGLERGTFDDYIVNHVLRV